MDRQNPKPHPHVHSNNSGKYNPGPVNETDWLAEELSIVQAQQMDLQREEFPEGPYGAATNETKLGKTSPWRPGQAFTNSNRDQNPMSSDRKVPMNEPDADEPIGTIEGQN